MLLSYLVHPARTKPVHWLVLCRQQVTCTRFSFKTTCSLDTQSVFSSARVGLADTDEVGAIRQPLQSPGRFFPTHPADKPSANQHKRVKFSSFTHNILLSRFSGLLYILHVNANKKFYYRNGLFNYHNKPQWTHHTGPSSNPIKPMRSYVVIRDTVIESAAQIIFKS